ncbi:Uncharacterized protein OS=Rhodopirellula maiorica SM1 GN=RMSM_04820 PE=4 SV=1 [Gemmataceae bacterium]|nr:Uncharacterized protein OS=Rhodopirellula maiorica SM1 GN=RMSM_04820 PE=4 SV=1 [Gemmataceae bacterium]VTT97696.1 Uncharacterized protein OS=Rhodopirellula maiorica SM1 GN=RMSM_04820 PE=4 SV=1 [Gemmataceae bacterium]
MALADDIRTARDRATAELVAAHDYHADTITAWNLVIAEIQAGRHLNVPNAVTGTVTTESVLAAKIPDYRSKRLTEATFHSFLAIFEAFLIDFVRAYPQNLAAADPVPVDVVLEAKDKLEITDFLIDRAIVGLLYRKPADWFAYLERRLKLGCPSAAEVERIAEAKATRDVLMHNRGVVNEVYVAKAGALARFTAGQFIDIPEPYHQDLWEMLLKVVAELSDATAAKFP